MFPVVYYPGKDLYELSFPYDIGFGRVTLRRKAKKDILEARREQILDYARNKYPDYGKRLKII